MGSKPDSKPESEPNSVPKLCLYSLPTKPSEPPGLLTPPMHTLASIPFQWEEVPGKPRKFPGGSGSTPPRKLKVARCLDLPPRLKTESGRIITNMPSPTTVLDGPNSGRVVFKTMSFRTPVESLKSMEGVRFSSWRWGGDISGISGNIKGNFDFSDSFVKKNNTKVKRRSSFLRLSNNSLLGNVYESLKKVVPWKRRQVKSRNMSI